MEMWKEVSRVIEKHGHTAKIYQDYVKCIDSSGSYYIMIYHQGKNKYFFCEGSVTQGYKACHLEIIFSKVNLARYVLDALQGRKFDWEHVRRTETGLNF